MTLPVETKSGLKVEFRLQNCSLTKERLAYLEAELGNIPRMVAKFPTAHLHLDIHKHPGKGDYHIKMSLKLDGETLFTGDRHHDLIPCFHACVSKMTHSIKDFKGRLNHRHQWDREKEISE